MHLRNARLLLGLALCALPACSDHPVGGDDAGPDAGAAIDAGRDAGTPDDAAPGDAGGHDGGETDGGSEDAGEPDAGASEPDAGASEPDAGEPDADAGEPDAGATDAGATDAGPPDAGLADPCSPLPAGLTTWTRSDSASSGTPDTYFLDVMPGTPFCASITGGGSGRWWVNVSNGTSSGLYCSGSATCSILVPAGQETLLVTAVTDDIGFYTLTVRYHPR